MTVTQLRKSLFTPSSHTEALAQIGQLEAAFLKAFGRRTAVELFMSSQWTDKHTIFGVTAYYENTAEAKMEVEWMEGAVP